jgi:uncharacterized protein (TIGR02453 family)
MKRQTFSAFPKEGLQFLRLLKRNNNREWFQRHKGIYESHVKAPMHNLIEALGRDFQTFAPEFVASPKVSAYRIHRDTRFAKDKSPYKTHIAASFPHAALGKHEGAGLYLHISSSEMFIGGGLYMPLPEDLQVLRSHIAENPRGFERIVRGAAFRRMFGSIHGEQLTRVPRGFPADHPAADYLKYKQFLASRTLQPEIATSPEFYKTVVETFHGLLPFIRFLNEPILAARRTRERQEALMRF